MNRMLVSYGLRVYLGWREWGWVMWGIGYKTDWFIGYSKKLVMKEADDAM